MFKINRFILISFWLIGAYLLSACGGTLSRSSALEVAPKALAKEVVFTGIVEAINGNQWVVSGQTVTVDPEIAMASNVTIGAFVKAEGIVSSDSTVVALKIESFVAPADHANDDDDADKVFGVVESLAADSVMIGGVAYQITSFTKFEDVVAVGDQVEIEIAVNVDGTFSALEIEKVDDVGDDDDADDDIDSGTDDDDADGDDADDDDADDDDADGDDDDDDDDEEDDND
ncbi:MAG: hypothetical protein HS124_06495 [Anaerolineales bacterium]|nr:hypothetical protein [Anaerolineales bacterium]